jgi:hypothetical protein
VMNVVNPFMHSIHSEKSTCRNKSLLPVTGAAPYCNLYLVPVHAETE